MKLCRVIIAGIVAATLLGGCSAPAPIDSGIRGTVTLGPKGLLVQPGESTVKPYSAALVIKPQGGRSSVAKVTSDADGRFTVALEPGTYVIRAASNKPGSALEPVSVSVAPHAYTDVAVPFSGPVR